MRLHIAVLGIVGAESARCRTVDPIWVRALEIHPGANEDRHLGPVGYYTALPAQRQALERNPLRANGK